MKEINLLGIRKRAILSRIKAISGQDVVVMKPIDEDAEKLLDKEGVIVMDGVTISQKSVFFYGSIDFSNPEDLDFIKKCSLIDDSQQGNIIHSKFDYNKGVAYCDEVPKTRPTWDAIEWMKYNYCLIGKPERVIVYQTKQSYLR